MNNLASSLWPLTIGILVSISLAFFKHGSKSAVAQATAFISLGLACWQAKAPWAKLLNTHSLIIATMLGLCIAASGS